MGAKGAKRAEVNGASEENVQSGVPKRVEDSEGSLLEWSFDHDIQWWKKYFDPLLKLKEYHNVYQ